MQRLQSPAPVFADGALSARAVRVQAGERRDAESLTETPVKMAPTELEVQEEHLTEEASAFLSAPPRSHGPCPTPSDLEQVAHELNLSKRVHPSARSENCDLSPPTSSQSRACSAQNSLKRRRPPLDVDLSGTTPNEQAPSDSICVRS